MLTLCLSTMLLVNCTPHTEEPENPTEEENPKAGENGEYCWKVTATTDGGLITSTEYWWDTEEEVKAAVDALNAAVGENIYSYEKSNAQDKNECTELDNAAKEDDPTHGNFDWKTNYEKAAPGIYMNNNELLAKGTDGCIYYIPDVTQMQLPETGDPCIPGRWQAWDGKSSTYSFSMYYCNDYNKDTVFCCTEHKWDASQLEDMVDAYGGRIMFSAFHDYTKVADAGDFEQTYVELAKRVQVRGSIVKPSDMILCYTEHKCQWLSDRYPEEMEAKKYVFRYAGSGSIREMTINRSFEWGKNIDNPLWVWMPPCHVDEVATVIVELENVSETDAAAFIQKVREEGTFCRITEDVATDGYLSFDADSWNYYDLYPDEKGENQRGYVYPRYTLYYLGGMFHIEFNVVISYFV